MGRYTFNLDGYSEDILLKLAEQKILGPTIRTTLRIIIQDWMASNQAKLKEWGINLNQIEQELLDKMNVNSPKN